MASVYVKGTRHWCGIPESGLSLSSQILIIELRSHRSFPSLSGIMIIYVALQDLHDLSNFVIGMTTVCTDHPNSSDYWFFAEHTCRI
jgi:hypothetical protein